VRFSRRVFFAILVVAGALSAQQTALDRYVAQKDAVYGWKLIRTIPGDGYKTHVLELTSQTWRTEKDVDLPVWKHWLTIVRPDKVASNKGFLYITGGSKKDAAPLKPSDNMVKIALETGTVATELTMVPNQPLRFSDSPDVARSEDDTIAYTWVKQAATKDDTWLVRLPMVKSGVRAMDAVQEFLATEDGGKLKVDQFVVAGGSKRGWTTWLVGVVDPRVIAIVPIVIDTLNSDEVTIHHFEAYGFFSDALKDYMNHGLIPWRLGTPEITAIRKIEDPYEYRNRPALKMPKFLINASGDQYFLPDGSQFYYKDLQEEKHIRYVPNAKHNLAGSDAVESEIAFYHAIVTNTPRPKFSWKKQADGSIVVTATDKPTEVHVWAATNPNARDFRVDTIGKAYASSTLTPEKNGTYVARVPKPEKGFTAFFVELVYPGPGKYPFKFTTEVSVVPDVLPFKWEDAVKKYPEPKK
jgi:PhoPQ-activated pathogenicity-related protein